MLWIELWVSFLSVKVEDDWNMGFLKCGWYGGLDLMMGFSSIENANQGKQERSVFGRPFQKEMQNNEDLVSHDNGSDRSQDSGVSSDVSTPLTQHDSAVSTKDDLIRLQHGNGGAKSISQSIPTFYGTER